MTTSQKPVIGLLGIMQELYDDMLPGITERQEDYARQVAKRLADRVDVRFPGAARDRNDIEKYMRGFEADGCEGIIVVNLTYGPAMRIVNAFRNVRLPVLMANIQPEPAVTAEWDMSNLTYNQGVHGAQDTSNSLMRLGVRFLVVTDDWRSESFAEAVTDFAHAAGAVNRMRQARVAIMGQMPGMGDILTDTHAFMRRLGPQIDHVNLGLVAKAMDGVKDAEIDAVIAANRKNFEIDPAITEDTHRYAARLQAAIKKVIDAGGYDAWSLYFDQIGDDGRFRQTHMMAASNLMAEGYGYSAEGDSSCASLMVAGYAIAPDPHFTEMYAMDFGLDAVLQSHMGEGNWKIARKDRPVQLIDRPLGIGGLDNPPTVLFQAQPGPATLVSLVPVLGEHYRLVVTLGTILDTDELPNVEMPYFMMRPQNGVRECLNGWLRNGGTHHQVLHLGDTRARWRAFCDLVGIEYAEV